MKKKLFVMLSVLLCVGYLSAQTNVGESTTSQRKDVKKAVSESKTLPQKVDMQEQQAPDVLSYVGANIRGGKVLKKDLLANPFIRAASKNTSATDLHWKVKSYQVVFIYQGLEEAPLTCTGSSFSEEVKKNIQQAEPGTIIVFQKIRAMSEAGEQTLDEIVVKLE